MASGIEDVVDHSMSEKCLAAQDFDWSFVISLGLVVGIVISYIPQVARPPHPADHSIIALFSERAARASVCTSYS